LVEDLIMARKKQKTFGQMMAEGKALIAQDARELRAARTVSQFQLDMGIAANGRWPQSRPWSMGVGSGYEHTDGPKD
jgi:hypothetical protein